MIILLSHRTPDNYRDRQAKYDIALSQSELVEDIAFAITKYLIEI